MEWLIYGATGYTAKLISDIAKGRGLKPILAGRSKESVEREAARHGFRSRAFSLSDPAAIKKGLEGCGLVLNCAGPFVDTYGPLAKACMENGVHYLDITGEIGVFEALAALGPQAKQKKVTLMPGVGFDVVPSDCLANHVSEKLPGATELELAFRVSSAPSPGTTKTMVRHMHEGNWVRRDGKLTRVPPGTPTQEVPFKDGTRHAVSIPWGDVATAFYSTKIPNITVYSVMSGQSGLVMKAMRWAGPLMRRPTVQNLVDKAIDRWVPGPDEHTRKVARVRLWARAKRGDQSAQAWLEVKEGYQFTALAAVAIVEKFLAEPTRWSGYLTPAMAFGSDFVKEIEGSRLTE